MVQAKQWNFYFIIRTHSAEANFEFRYRRLSHCDCVRVCVTFVFLLDNRFVAVVEEKAF